MRRFLLKISTTLLILLLLFGGGFYVGQASRAKQEGEGYALSDLPGDMVDFFAGLVASAVEALPEPEDDPAVGETPPETEPEKPVVIVPETPDDMNAGRDHFDAGRFREAATAWKRVLEHSWTQALSDDIEMANLFAVVAEQFPRGRFSDTEDTVIVELRSGARYEGRLISKSDEGVEVGLADGSGIMLPADQIVETSVCTRVNRTEVFEKEYRRRLGEVRSPRGYGYLELVEWCRAHDLDGHLPYLLDKIREIEKTEGIVLGTLLVEKRRGLSDYERQEVDALLERFYPNAPATREARLASLGVARADEPWRPSRTSGSARSDAASSGEAPSDDFITRLERAKALAAKGKHHYNKAAPGMPNRAEHREKAKKALTEAKVIFEALLDERDEMWLQRHLKAVYEMLYWMRKDSPVE
jgi:hypothetical protein